MKSFKRKSIRMKVQNDGGSVAEKCRATISEISRVDECSCPALTTKFLRWFPSGQTEQDVYPHGLGEMLEVVFADELLAPPISAECKVQKTDKAQVFAWASTPDNLVRSLHYADGFCSGGFEMTISVYPKNSDKAIKRVKVSVGNSWSELDMTILQSLSQ